MRLEYEFHSFYWNTAFSVLAPGQICPQLWHWKFTTWSEEKRREREEKQRTIKLQKYPMSTLEKKCLVDLKWKLGCRQEVAAWTWGLSIKMPGQASLTFSSRLCHWGKTLEALQGKGNSCHKNRSANTLNKWTDKQQQSSKSQKPRKRNIRGKLKSTAKSEHQ